MLQVVQKLFVFALLVLLFASYTCASISTTGSNDITATIVESRGGVSTVVIDLDPKHGKIHVDKATKKVVISFKEAFNKEEEVELAKKYLTFAQSINQVSKGWYVCHYQNENMCSHYYMPTCNFNVFSCSSRLQSPFPVKPMTQKPWN